MKKIYAVKLIVFLAAFLLFQIELIIAKVLLPQFGGGYAVWGAAVVFFQATLLAGYFYSHLVISRLGIARYRYIHLGLLALTLLFFPGRALPPTLIPAHLPMVINISWQLLSTIGVSFFFLSTTSIIFQSWLASSELEERANPYVLYGISNLGSFAALLTYPFLFESFFDLNVQLNTWRVLYFLLALLHVAALAMIKIRTAAVENEKVAPRVDIKDVFRWFLLGAAGVIMFLSITNVITYEIMPMPLLWIMPLSIYLLSFAVSFKKDPWRPAWIREKIHIVLGLSVVIYFLMEARTVDLAIMVIVYLAALFAVCMFCQGELYRTKPEKSAALTLFYLVLSLGGFFGGITVSWIMPLVSSSPVEYLVGLLAVSLALTVGQQRPFFYSGGKRRIAALLILLIIWPVIFWGYNVFGIVLLGWAFCAAYSRFKEKPFMMSLSILLVLGMAASPITSMLWSKQRVIYRHRNYYGIYKIYQAQEKRYLSNGSTMHGAQYLVKEREMLPITYYHYSTPVGALFSSPSFEFKNIGVIGLGTGTMAAYGRPGQTMDFFELDPDVVKIAVKYFTFLKNSPAKIDYILGDARITMKKTPADHYDVLVVDAFSGDYIPAHLLTTDAINEYKKHLTGKGIILFHVSNRYLTLEPVLFAGAAKTGSYACMARNQASLDGAASAWVALTWDKGVFDLLISGLKWTPAPKKLPLFIRPWTDAYTNVMGVLRAGYLIDQVKTFQPFYWSFNFSPERRANLRYYAAQGGRSLIESDYNQSIGYYQKALELNPSDPNLLRNMGNVYYLSGQYQQAIASYQKAVRINPADADAMRNLGRTYARQNLYDEAIASYKKVVEIKPGDSEAFLELGRAYTALGKYEEAASYYKKAVDLNPNAFNMVLAYKFQQDVLNYQKALEAKPDDMDALLNLGNAYNFLQRHKEAAACYQKIIDRNPDNNNVAEKLGDIYYKQADYQKAVTYYLKVAAARPKGAAGIMQKLGGAYARQGNYTEALDYYNKALSEAPEEPGIYMGISAVYARLKQGDKMVDSLLKARSLFKDRNDLAGVRQVDKLLSKIKTK